MSDQQQLFRYLQAQQQQQRVPAHQSPSWRLRAPEPQAVAPAPRTEHRPAPLSPQAASALQAMAIDAIDAIDAALWQIERRQAERQKLVIPPGQEDAYLRRREAASRWRERDQ